MKKALVLALALSAMLFGSAEARDWMRQQLHEGYVPEGVEGEPVPQLFQNEEEAVEALRNLKDERKNTQEPTLEDLKKN